MTKISFEKNLARLEDIVTRLESEDVPLEESMKLFEEGVKLSRICSDKLDKAEKKIEILTTSKSGEKQIKPFTAEEV